MLDNDHFSNNVSYFLFPIRHKVSNEYPQLFEASYDYNDVWKCIQIISTNIYYLQEPCCNGRCCVTGTQFVCTKSGQIHTLTFQQQFSNVFLKHASTQTGENILIGDHLSCNLPPSVVKTAIDNNIHFLFLVPNSIHLTQPLDVSFFRPFQKCVVEAIERVQNAVSSVQNNTKIVIPL